METSFKLGLNTLLDPNAVEYQWIRSLASEGTSRTQINASIQRCLGGDQRTANLLRQVAIKEVSINQLLTELHLLVAE
ncbi:hypothetical protein [Thaumasiovibrio subtropicus]|uniref:hypothetical protein n=1 Tax=Thaumasiovibrio subtropicus TaxID=1891207 RepID=UPI000B35EBCC|nr:hypothetical protein [Thaumasiovibrio subtropicus]